MRACLLAPLVLLLSCHADWDNAAQFQPPALAMLVWHGSTDIAVGRAERGPWQMNESGYDYVDDPTVAIDERGGIAVAWVDQARKDVLFQRFSADGRKLGQWVNVSRSPAVFSWLPRIVVDSKQGVFVLWQEIIFSGGSHGGDILFARSEDGGRNFSAPVNLSSSIAGDGKGRINKDYWHNGSLDLALGADGTLYVAWTEYEGALWVRRSRDGGRTFSGRLRISEAKPARGPALALGPNGIVYLAWTVGDEAAGIRVVKSTDGGGSFAAPRDISGANAGFPALNLDGKGNLYVLWERFADSPVRPRGLALALSNDGGGAFAEPVLVPESADAGGNGSL